jgi:hypothetical protein
VLKSLAPPISQPFETGGMLNNTKQLPNYVKDAVGMSRYGISCEIELATIWSRFIGVEASVFGSQSASSSAIGVEARLYISIVDDDAYKTSDARADLFLGKHRAVADADHDPLPRQLRRRL